jgi:3-dehydroquinate synthase
MPVRLDVASARGGYSVIIGAGVLEDARALFEAASLALPATIVSAGPIWQAQGARIASISGGAEPVLMPDGERAKTLRSLRDSTTPFPPEPSIVRPRSPHSAAASSATSPGFAAASYLRGLRYVQIPTTLLAQGR